MSRKSLTLPGMKSDWEIDPDELEICRRTDGSEWELGSGASARVSLHTIYFHLLQALACLQCFAGLTCFECFCHLFAWVCFIWGVLPMPEGQTVIYCTL